MNKIKVKNSGTIKLKMFKDYPDGDLFIAEARREIPFDIKRIYFINNFKDSSAVRGRHAHKKLRQVIICLGGSFDLLLDDGRRRQILKMNDPSIGVLLGNYLWHEMDNFSGDCVILVLAGDHYKESDYIRDYNEFKKRS
ncbi:MAG: FdtA/QdtA family cupin domain-containing protein [Candidatus Yanofskybacteria bacterium]|nr:FdtA/QdtA family cupin domain-containing protein [Candidatus Yanofskybacteria bacterium]